MAIEGALIVHTTLSNPATYQVFQDAIGQYQDPYRQLVEENKLDREYGRTLRKTIASMLIDRTFPGAEEPFQLELYTAVDDYLRPVGANLETEAVPAADIAVHSVDPEAQGSTTPERDAISTLPADAAPLPAEIETSVDRAEAEAIPTFEQFLTETLPGHHVAILKTWLGEKGFGFITHPDSSSLKDLFVHSSSFLRDQNKVSAGALISFEVGERGGKPVTVNVRLPIIEYLRKYAVTGDLATVKFWFDQGRYGVLVGRGGAEFRIRESALQAIPRNYLYSGERVSLATITFRGAPLQFITKMAGMSDGDRADAIYRFCDFGDPNWIEELAAIAQPEDWEFGDRSKNYKKRVLRDYLRYTFLRLTEMEGGIKYSSDGTSATFNTGLSTPLYQSLYCMMRHRPDDGMQPWRLHKFITDGEREFADKFGGYHPPLAEYYDDTTELIFNPKLHWSVNAGHVIHRMDRLESLRDMKPAIAVPILDNAISVAVGRVRRSYKVAIPQYFRDKNDIVGKIQLLLPLCIKDNRVADGAIAVYRTETKLAYVGATLLTLEDAYSNARVLAKPDDEWLIPPKADLELKEAIASESRTVGT